MKMKLEEYIEVMLPMVKLIDQEKKENQAGYKVTQLWYLYRQYFYGFAEFIDRKVLINVSKMAQIEFEVKRPEEKLENQNWKDQPKFDSKRKVFNLDHIYTGEMFRNSIEDMILKGDLTVEAISILIKDNYRMAWILKEEEKKLPRSNRGKTLNDALENYKKCGIELIKKQYLLYD